MISGEIVSPTRLLFHYIKELSNSDKIRAFIALKIIYLIIFFEDNGKCSVYTGGDIHGIYRYLETIGAPTTLTTSGQRSHHLSPSSSITNDAATLQPVIAALLTIQKSIYKCCGIIGHQYDACIIYGKISPTKS